MTRVEFRVIFEVYYIRSMELPGVIFVSLFLAFSCLDCVRGISKSKKKKEKKEEEEGDFGSLGTYLTLFVCTLVRPVCWQYCCVRVS